MKDLKKIQEFFSKPLNEVSGNIDIEDFNKVVQAISQTNHPVTVMLNPMFGRNEIEILIGMNAPDPIGDAMFNIMTDLGYRRGDFSIVGDTSTYSRREYSDIRRVNGGHRDYQRWEESVSENKPVANVNKHIKDIQVQLQQLGVKYEMSDNPYKPFKVVYKPVNKDDRWYKDFDDIIWRYNLGGVVKTVMNEALMLDKYEVDFFHTKANVYANIEIPSENPTFEDDIQIKGTGKTEEEAFGDLKRNYENYKKTGIHEAKKLTYNDFVRMVRDDMMAGSAPDERPSDKLVASRAKSYYNDYLQGASVDDLFEATKEEDQTDIVAMDVPLFIRVLEYAREDAQADMDLHDLAEKAIAGTKEMGVLTMDNYDMLVGEKESVDETELTEAYVPSNIKEFAKRRGISSLVNKVAGWAEKVGARITGGTAIGKGYNTLILDLGYQTADIRIDIEEESIELYDEPIYSFNDFKNVFMEEVSRQQAEHDEEQLRRERGLEEVVSKVISQIKEDRPGLWANIHAKRERGEKPSPKGSKAYKSAVKAGKKINAMTEADLSPEEIEKQFLAKIQAAPNPVVGGEVKLDPKIEDKIKKSIEEGSQLTEEQLNEIVDPVTIGTLVIGAPGLLKLFKWISQAIGWLMGLNKGDGNMFSRAFEKAEHWLHNKYIKLIIKALRTAYPVYNSETDENMEKIANRIYMAMLTGALIASGMAAAKAAHGVIAAAGEGVHAGVTATDIAAIGAKIAAEA